MNERARQLYLQCCTAYQEYLKIPNIPRTILGDGKNGIIIPSYFYDNYNVPAELLYEELLGYANVSEGERISFDHKLLRLVNDNKGYDEARLISKSPRQISTRKFNIYFEVYFNKTQSAPELFKKQLTIHGIKFSWCNTLTFSHVVSCFESGTNLASSRPNVLNGDGFPGLYKIRRNERFPKLTNDLYLHAIKASVTAANEIDAVNLVAAAFDGFMDCVNVTQSLGAQDFNLTGGPIKSKSVIVSVGVFLAKSDVGKIDILWEDTARHVLPKQSLELTANQSKMKFLNNLLRAFCDDSSPAAKRIRQVTSEIAQAIDTDNSNLRQLGFWRCLEIAARNMNENRKDKDIIKIFQNYYPQTKHWHQQGEIIHRTRNNYVHQGVSSESGNPNDFRLNWSQKYAEAALKILVYLYNHKSVWKTDTDIDIFFDNYSRSNRELEFANKFLNARRNTRSGK